MKTIFPRIAFVLFASLFVLVSCIKDDFDEPPQRTIPVGSIKTIAELRNMFQGQPIKIDQDWSVYAVVTMDERNGNIYKSAYIQDNTGAVNLHLNSSGGVYQGDSIRLYLKGTILSDYAGVLQIDSVDVDENIIKQATMVQRNPELVTIQDIKTGFYQSKLIRLDSVQFKASEMNKTYADAINKYSMNRVLQDCANNEILVRTSGYANFAGELLPQGKGSLVAIVSEYNGEMQLYIRSLAETQLTGERCGGSGNQDLITIAALRNMFTGTTMNIPANKKIKGIIISDKDNSNITSKNAFIMDASGSGIVMRFTANNSLAMGAEVEINVSGLELSQFNGLLQINNVPNDNAFYLGQGTMPQPIVVTIDDILDDFEEFESKLVRIMNVTISKDGGFTDYIYTTKLNDGTGVIDMFTTAYATFATQNFPTVPVHITGIVSQYNTPQINIRNLNDVVIAK